MMRTTGSVVGFVALIAQIPGCARIQTESTVTTTSIGTREVQGAGHDRRLTASVTEGPDSFALTVTSTETCTMQKADVFRKTRTTRRTIQNRSTVIAEWVLGGAALVAGGVVTVDAGNVPPANDPNETNPVGRTGAYGIGIGLASVGVVALTVGLVNAVGARDSTDDDGEGSKLRDDFNRDVTCNQAPAIDVPLRLVARDGRSLDIGVTGAAGRLMIPWAVVPAEWLRSSSWASQAYVMGPDDTELATVALVKLRAALSEKEWIAAKRDGSAVRLKQFLKDFSEAHTKEATQLYNSARSGEIDREVSAALAAKDVEQATKLLDEWKTLAPDSQALSARRREVATLARDLNLDRYGKEFAASLAASVGAKGVSLDSYQTAVARLAALGSLIPPDPQFKQRTAQLAKTRRKIISTIAAGANRSAARGEFDEALGQLASAKNAQLDDPIINSTEAKINKQMVAAAKREERKRAAEEKAAQRRKACAMSCLSRKRYQASCAAQNAGNRGGMDFGYELCVKAERCSCALKCGLKEEPIMGFSCP